MAVEILERVEKIIENNLENASFSIDFLCKQMGVSRSYLHRVIKEQTGLSTSLFIRKIRLEKARELLLLTDHNISQISYMTGINSPQNFSKYFAEQYGDSPSNYRRKNTSQGNAESFLNPVDQPLQDVESKWDDQSSESKLKVSWSLGIFPMVMVIMLLLVYRWKNQQPKPSSEHFINSIAVLPFANFGVQSSDFFVEGIVEDILTNLASFDDLKVISRTSTMIYKNTEKSLKQIAKELGVAYILEGSVRKEENQIRVTAQLIRAADDYHVWAKNYTREMKDIFKLQGEISMEIATTLNHKISSQFSARVNPLISPDYQAYNEFLIGRDLMMQRTNESLKASIERFDRALEIEPGFSRALAHKANAYQLLANSAYEDRKYYNSLAEDLALKTIDIDPGNGLAYATLGGIYKDQYKWRQSETSFQIALKHSPNDALINYWYSLLLREVGDLNAAVRLSARACELDPLHPVIFGGHVVNCVYAKNWPLADQSLMDGKAQFQNSFLYLWAQAKYAEQLGDYEKAIRLYDKALEFNPNIPSVQYARIFCLARIHKNAEVQNYLAELPQNETSQCIAKVFACAGFMDEENTLKYLNEALQIDVLPPGLKIDSTFDFLRDNPDFTVFLDRINLKESRVSL